MKKEKHATLEKFEELSKDVDRLLLKVWALENPPKFKEGDIVQLNNSEKNKTIYEYRILGFVEARPLKTFLDSYKPCNVYCAIDMQSESTNCIELIDGFDYNTFKLKK